MRSTFLFLHPLIWMSLQLVRTRLSTALIFIIFPTFYVRFRLQKMIRWGVPAFYTLIQVPTRASRIISSTQPKFGAFPHLNSTLTEPCPGHRCYKLLSSERTLDSELCVCGGVLLHFATIFQFIPMKLKTSVSPAPEDARPQFVMWRKGGRSIV